MIMIMMVSACAGQASEAGDVAAEQVSVNLGDLDRVLAVSGRIDPGNETVRFNPAHSLPGTLAPAPTSAASAEYILIAANFNGLTMSTVNFAVDEDGRFAVALPLAADRAVSQLRVERDGLRVGFAQGDSTIPTVTITSPQAGQRFESELELTWTGSDEEVAAVVYDVYISLDDGATWEVVAIASPADRLVVPNDFEATDTARLLVSASDQMNAAHVISERFSIG